MSLFNILVRTSLLRDSYGGFTRANYFCLVYGVSNSGAVYAKQRCCEILALPLGASMQTEDLAGNEKQFSGIATLDLGSYGDFFYTDTKAWPPPLLPLARLSLVARPSHPKAPELASHRWAADQELRMKAVVPL